MKKLCEKAKIRIIVFGNSGLVAASDIFDDEGRIELPLVPAK